ncbi:HNH endonuclease [Archangium violaceum]|uniref:HNH endonuclease n=1 Tax=Archangium violaceum TaxID=83451 RepID=UPI001EF3DB53|nr:HNH endonuclease signature motif containing protein [Archangium violaceum]
MVAEHAAATAADPSSQHLLPVDSATIAAGKKGGKPPSKGTANGERAYMRFTPKGKQEVRDENAQKHGGENQCENCGVTTVEAQKSQKGVTPPKTETQVDHVIPRAKGGDGSPSNGQVLCRECNNEKSDKQ